MKGLFLRLEKIHQKVEEAVVFLSGVIIIIMFGLISSEVILRTVLKMSIPGIFEMASQMMVAISLLGISYVQQKKEHITVDLISERAPVLFNNITNLLVVILGLLITSVYCWQGWISFYHSWQSHEYTLGIVHFPLWPGKLVVAISMLIIAIRFFLDIITQLFSFGKEKNKNHALVGQHELDIEAKPGGSLIK